MHKILKEFIYITKLIIIKLKIFYYKYANKAIKLIIGAGGISHRGWIATDINTLNIIDGNDWRRLFPPLSVSAILAEHVFEHLSFDEASKAFENCFHYLKYSGYIRIAVPDGLNPSKEYIQNVMPGGQGLGAMDHKVLYDYNTLAILLESKGFKVILLEYYDENGNFQYNEWTPEMGLISRSKRFDPRNQGGEFLYSSLIVDAIKTSKN
jgi:predicted SAM-dependent methyltransferase